jgi:two-component system sensor histidine kinase KdpD
MKVNGPARKVLRDGKQALGGPNLGTLIAGLLDANEKDAGLARLFLSADGDVAVTVVLSEDQPGQSTPGEAPSPKEEGSMASSVLEKHRLADYIAHELKSPLGTILGMSKALRLRQKTLPEVDRAEAIESIEAEAERSLLIVQGLLRLVEGRTGSSQQPSYVPLHAVLRRVVGDHRRRNPERTVVLSGDSPMYAQGDSLGVELALANLLNNAEKYAPRREPIHIAFHDEVNRSTIFVLNSGDALPPERYQRLWDIYASGPDPEVMVTGSGIGLALCKELVEMMGGRVWAGPTQNRGSVFAITLPSASDGGGVLVEETPHRQQETIAALAV